MERALFFIIAGYFSGSVLYADVFGTLFGEKDFYKESADQNPGTANAFVYGGFLCGTLTLLCDLLKGFLPVYLYLRSTPVYQDWYLSCVLASPVIGHIFPVFHKFHGGKGIATTFGCLLGLYKYLLPVLLFAAAFIFLSLVLRISPHYYRTLAAYLSTLACMILFGIAPAVWFSFLLITLAVCFRFYLSKEEKDKLEVKLLWRH